MKLVAIEFFSGAGGLSQGLKDAGFDIAFANELNASAALTYSNNHPEIGLFAGDIRKITSSEIIKQVGEKPILVAGGPPCQGFSMAGRRHKNDPRNLMFKEFITKVREIKPEYFLVENVTGILSFNKGRTILDLEKSFRKAGYHVSKRVLNAASFGVPQIRRRLFIFGSLESKIDINDMIIKKQRTPTVKEAISDLDFIDSGGSSDHYGKIAASEYQRRMRIGSNKLYNHISPNHTQNVIKRFSMIHHDNSIKIPSHMKTKKRTLVRINGSRPINTLTTIPDDYIHYSLNRTLTVRECARLQSFKDTYIFFGPRTTGGKKRVLECPQYTQVGNAIPPLLAKAIGTWIISQP